MDSVGPVRVFGTDGLLGALGMAPGRDDQVVLWLENGKQVLLPADLLQQRDEDTYYIPMSAADLGATAGLKYEETVMPVVEETLQVRKRTVEKGRVRVRKVVREHEEVVDEPVFEEKVEVERVPVDREVDGPVPVHYEGDVLVVPLLEEVLVVTKRLVLREELRITRRRVENHEPQQFTLRAEEAIVERLPGQELAQPGDVDQS